jgi:hypothetical protein
VLPVVPPCPDVPLALPLVVAPPVFEFDSVFVPFVVELEELRAGLFVELAGSPFTDGAPPALLPEAGLPFIDGAPVF